MLALLPVVAGIEAMPPGGELAVRGTLRESAGEQRHERFALRATLTPRKEEPATAALRLRLHAALRPKGTDALCYGPGHVFADGYELPP